MHRELYRFGGVTFAVESAEGIERSKMCEPFRVEDAAADHTICLTFSDAIPKPPQGAAQSGPVYRWQEGGARHLLQRYSAAGKTPQFTCAVTRGARTDVTFAESYRAGASVRAVLEAAGLFDIFADAGMLVLHSSYIVTRTGEGILFSGPSGIGKSTQAALWERFAGARTINGDRGLVCPAARTVSGIFYAGTSGGRPSGAGGGEPCCPRAAAGGVRAAADPVRLLRVGRRVRRADDGAGGAARDERARLADGLPGG